MKGCFLVQDTNFYENLSNIDTSKKGQDSLKAFFQPLQAIYFDKNGFAESILVNCYAGFDGRQLNWNTENRLAYFPPKTHTNLFKKLHYNQILVEDSLKQCPLIEGRKKVFIYWSVFFW
jgi:hypothetical protein